MDHRISTDMTLACPLDRVFDFFSDAGNLEAITPPELRFEALSPTSTRIRDEVQYRLPFEPVGRLAHPLVRAKLVRIFTYREERVRARLEL